MMISFGTSYFFKLIYLLCIIFACPVSSVQLSNPYCEKNCQSHPGYVHTACFCDSSRNCSLIYKQDKKKLREKILEVHNELRSRIARGFEQRAGMLKIQATNMELMTYNTELEKIAKCHAKKCNLTSNFCRDKLDMGDAFWVGNNNAYHSPYVEGNQNELIENMIRTMYDEIENFSNFSKFIDSYHDDDLYLASHLTQIIWAKTKEVGCAQSFKKDRSKTYLVCLYYPGGNIENESIFRRGAMCSDCSRKCVNGLCGDKNRDRWKPSTARLTGNHFGVPSQKILIQMFLYIFTIILIFMIVAFMYIYL